MSKLSLTISLIVLILILAPKPAYAEWPPFDFALAPSFENGRITYHIQFYSRVNWVMTDITFKIPLPQGTRFVESNSQPTTKVDFDGAELTFFSYALSNRSLENLSFTVEITDPKRAVFTTKAWIAWKGEQPGDYVIDNLSFDIMQQTLNWDNPSVSRLQLELKAVGDNDIVTYTIYPANVDPNWRRMWDVKIRVPLPEGTTYLSTEVSPPFVAGFDGKEILFTTSELPHQAVIGPLPLKIKVSTSGVTIPFIITHAWATWKNVGSQVGIIVPPQEETRTGDIIVQPQVSQSVIQDTVADVPYSNYDLAGIGFGEAKAADLNIVFYTVGDIGPLGDALEFTLYIDTACSTDTGSLRYGLGADYLVNYEHYTKQGDRSKLYAWDEQAREWRKISGLNNSADKKIISIDVPYRLLPGVKRFCWAAEAENAMFNPRPPHDQLPNTDKVKLSYEIIGVATDRTAIDVGTTTVKPSEGVFIEASDTWRYWPGWSEPSAAWKSSNFDDSDWFSGPTSIGYGDGDYPTNLRFITRSTHYDSTFAFMQRVITETGVVLAVPLSGSDSASVFIRHTFTVPDPALLTQLSLEVTYEGGFVAYLNGREVTRRNLEAPGLPVFSNMLADGPGTKTSETIDFSLYISQLMAGKNLLAIQVHRSADATNLSMAPKLTWNYNPAETITAKEAEAPTPTPITPLLPLSISKIMGKLAIPLDNGYAFYDVHLFSLPAGQEIARIPNARQPNFRFDGQRLLINREGGGTENLYEYDLTNGTQTQVSDAPRDSHPFYDLYGNRVVYGNPELTYGKPEAVYKENKWYYTGVSKPFIFVQCGLLPPHQEKEPRCRDIPSLGVLIPAGQMSEIQGTNPVWTSNDMIAYKGCNSWSGFAACGIYIAPSSSTKGFSDGFIPRQLTRDTSDIPADTKGNLIAFMSQRDGNWEVYIMDLNGADVKNLSNSPTSSDGLPTISPDGNWVAFVSDRGGQWAVWVASVAGGEAQKLFDLPTNVPWGNGDRDWTNERISWGP